VASLGDDGNKRPGTNAANDNLSSDEVADLRLFIGKVQCINCHNELLFTNSEFNCLGPYSDAAAETCRETRFLKVGGDTFDGSFRTPTLRNVAETAPYMHGGQFATLYDVLQHYNRRSYTVVGHSELAPLNLSELELRQLEAFLMTLTGAVFNPALDPAAAPTP
jgi:cytochrome c peroxidase